MVGLTGGHCYLKYKYCALLSSRYSLEHELFSRRKFHRLPVMKSTTILLTLATIVYASSGDRDPSFQSCLSQRVLDQCRAPSPSPLALRLTRRTCEDECKYQCSHIMTDNAILEGRRPEQFYGKWAFWRFLGMQEPASVLFSLMNLWAHVRGGRNIRRRIRKGHPMRRYYLGFTAASLNLWIWSSVFHTRGKYSAFGSLFLTTMNSYS